MKKFLITVGSGIGVVAGALVIWNVVVPAINYVLSMFGTLITNLF